MSKDQFFFISFTASGLVFGNITMHSFDKFPNLEAMTDHIKKHMFPGEKMDITILNIMEFKTDVDYQNFLKT